MPARSGLSELLLLACALGGAPAALGSCSSPEKHDPTPQATVSCEASNTCGSGGGSLPPIEDPPVVAGPCGHVGSTCVGVEGGVDDASPAAQDDAPSEAASSPDAGVVDASDAAHLTDGGPG